jgi:hypothetical protein
MTARAAQRTLSTVAALAFSLLLALSFSTAAFAQLGDDADGEPAPEEDGQQEDGFEGFGDDDAADDGTEDDGTEDDGTEEGGLGEGLGGDAEDGTGDDGEDFGDDGTDDGFGDDGTAEGFGAEDDGFDAGATVDDGFDDGAAAPQVDAPAGGVEAGFGGLAAAEGDPLLAGFLWGSLALILGVAGLTWWRKVATTA